MSDIDKKEEVDVEKTEETSEKEILEEVVDEVEEKIEEPVKEEAVEEESDSTNDEIEDKISDEPKETISEEKSIWEKVKEFELDTKIGLILAVIIVLAVFINIHWINYTWWLILIISGFALRNLNKQRNELEEDKPFEARIANISFLSLIVILVIRDLMITSRLSELVDILKP
ncbi:MAG: hypothetical protein JXR48_11050 [Candidatus Delongbacteria bacterium]|nr:hypothetical protein [Candidatus Delongbacteria bacterium]MBN2835490.1 hypothetical protein [Candidatus Delongbacteria bacterium]